MTDRPQYGPIVWVVTILIFALFSGGVALMLVFGGAVLKAAGVTLWVGALMAGFLDNRR